MSEVEAALYAVHPRCLALEAGSIPFPGRTILAHPKGSREVEFRAFFVKPPFPCLVFLTAAHCCLCFGCPWAGGEQRALFPGRRDSGQVPPSRLPLGLLSNTTISTAGQRSRSQEGKTQGMRLAGAITGLKMAGSVTGGTIGWRAAGGPGPTWPGSSFLELPSPGALTDFP